jgi:hypothetical protein
MRSRYMGIEDAVIAGFQCDIAAKHTFQAFHMFSYRSLAIDRHTECFIIRGRYCRQEQSASCCPAGSFFIAVTLHKSSDGSTEGVCHSRDLIHQKELARFMSYTSLSFWHILMRCQQKSVTALSHESWSISCISLCIQQLCSQWKNFYNILDFLSSLWLKIRNVILSKFWENELPKYGALKKDDIEFHREGSVFGD